MGIVVVHQVLVLQNHTARISLVQATVLPQKVFKVIVQLALQVGWHIVSVRPASAVMTTAFVYAKQTVPESENVCYLKTHSRQSAVVMTKVAAVFKANVIVTPYGREMKCVPRVLQAGLVFNVPSPLLLPMTHLKVTGLSLEWYLFGSH